MIIQNRITGLLLIHNTRSKYMFHINLTRVMRLVLHVLFFYEQKIEVFTKANSDLQTSLKYHKTSLHRVQKKLMLVAKERECYKQLIDSYEKDLTITNAASDINTDVQLRMKLDMVERSLNGYKELCATQEKELLASKSLPDLGMSSTISENYERFKKDMEVLRQENERLRRRKEELELMVEQISLKGAYNLDNKYKVVHMSANPNTEAQEKHQNEVEKLQAEVCVYLNCLIVIFELLICG